MGKLLPTPDCSDRGSAKSKQQGLSNIVKKELILDELISSQEDSPASLFPMQENEKEQTTAVISGQRCLRLSESLNRPMSLAKMLLASSAWKMAEHLKGYSLIWKMKGTRSNHLLFQLVPLVRGTDGTEYGLLPTMQTQGLKICENKKTKFADIKMLPIITTFADTQKAKCESTRDTRTGGNGFTNSCKDVSDTVSQRLQTRRKWNVSGNKEQSSKNYAKTENWWQSEPDVGRVAHGIPGTLDRINGINYETIRKELFALWQKDDPTRMGKWRERFNIQEQEILQFAMLWLLDRINIERKENEWKENCSTKIQINNLRTMWIERIIAEASQRWQYEEQQSKEHNNSLPGLPQERTPKEWNMGSIWNEEPNTPRVASGVRDRVDRLKGLGNAIVPQIAYELFKVIEQFNSINTAKQ